MDYAELVPTEDDLAHIAALLQVADERGTFGKCKEDPCRTCTALQRLNTLVNLMRQEDAWIGTK